MAILLVIDNRLSSVARRDEIRVRPFSAGYPLHADHLRRVLGALAGRLIAAGCMVKELMECMGANSR
jgi:hypothetical protein